MALRYCMPSLGREVSVQSCLKPLPAAKPPVTVSFRRGADVGKVVTEILASASVRLDAAVGAGKSVKVPPAMALSSGRLVLHVTPSPLLAWSLCTYVTKLANDNLDKYPATLAYCGEADFVLPSTGVVYMSAATLTALLLKQGTGVVRNSVCFFDEAHESDAFTYVVQKLALAWGVGNVVLSSATFGTTGFRKRESVAPVTEETFQEEEVVETWQPEDDGKPWSATGITQGLLVYVDSNTQAARLKLAYQDAGFVVYRLTSRSSVEYYSEAVRALCDERECLVALLVDYSFRSGFSFPVSHVVDSGYMMYVDATGRVAQKKTRLIFQFEAEQAAGRLGRFDGLSGKYYRPDFALQPQMAVLEGVEKDAAAILFRAFGYKPVTELMTSVCALGRTPRDIVSALAGLVPLNHLPLSSYEEVRSVSPPAVVVESVTAPIYSKAKEDVQCANDQSTFKKAVEPVVNAAEAVKLTLADQLADLTSAGFEEKKPLVAGTYYYSPGVVAVEGCKSPAFPRQYDSVRKLIVGGNFPADIAGLSEYDKSVALSLLLNRYNVLNVELEAMGKLLTTPAIDTSDDTFLQTVKSVVLDVLESSAVYDSERYQIMESLSDFVDLGFELRAFPGMDDLVVERCEFHRQKIVNVSSGGDSTNYDSYVKAVRSSFDATARAVGFETNPEVYTIQDRFHESGSRQTAVRFDKKKTRRRRSHKLGYHEVSSTLPGVPFVSKLVERTVKKDYDADNKLVREHVQRTLVPKGAIGRMLLGKDGHVGQYQVDYE